MTLTTYVEVKAIGSKS